MARLVVRKGRREKKEKTKTKRRNQD